MSGDGIEMTVPERPPVGIHYLVELYGCCPHQISSETFWQTILLESLHRSGIEILGRRLCTVTPHGITGHIVLSASHISVRTWPEYGYVACDVFICSGDQETVEVVHRIAEAVRHERKVSTTLRRGNRYSVGADGDLLPPRSLERCSLCQHCLAAGTSAAPRHLGSHFDVTNTDGEVVQVAIKRLLHSSKSPHQKISIYDTTEFGRCLLLDGVIQSAERDHHLYDRALLRMLRPGDERLLILGGDDGYTAEQAVRANPALKVTVVDLDGAVIEACRAHLGQRVFDQPQVEVVVVDAFRFLRDAGEDGYDGVICDLTDFPVGCDMEMVPKFFRGIFPLCQRALKPGGWISAYAGSSGVKTCVSGELLLDLLAGLLTRAFVGVERAEVLIPSFGEASNFLYGRKALR